MRTPKSILIILGVLLFLLPILPGCFATTSGYYTVTLESTTPGQTITVNYPEGVPDLFYDLYVAVFPIDSSGKHCLCFFYKTQEQSEADYGLILNCETLEMHVLADRTKEPIKWWIYRNGIPEVATAEEAEYYLNGLEEPESKFKPHLKDVSI